MNEIFEIPVQINVDGRAITVASVLADRVENQSVPKSEHCRGWSDFERFIKERAQAVFGKWPVVLLAPTHDSTDDRFTGYRIICLCKAVSSSNSSVIETAILVWYESMHWGSLRIPERRIKEIPWSSTAEAIEW